MTRSITKEKEIISLKEALLMNQVEVEELYQQYINPPLSKLLKMLGFNKVFLKAKDVSLWDEHQQEYLDFLGAYGSLNIGHNNDHVLEALKIVEEVPNLLQAGMHKLTAALAQNLAAITPGDLQYTFFCNSGAEAVEGALKLAKIATEKPRIVYCKGSFHGKSMGALSVTGRQKYREYFGPLVPLVEEVVYGSIDELRVMFETYEDIAAFILEPIQGEGGIIVPPVGYLRKVRELCNQYEVLMILDEVQTGFGRTGNWFACEEEAVVPDILCMAKSLGGGVVPIGAYIAREKVWNKGYGSLDKCLLHTSTFGGNAKACAAALATIQYILENDLEKEAMAKGAYLIDKLKTLKESYPLLKDVRGRGLMIGLEFEGIDKGIINMLTTENTRELMNEYVGGMIASQLIRDHHIITAYTLNNPNVIRIEPPLTVTYEQLDQFIEALESILKKHRGIGRMIVNNTKSMIKSFLGGRGEN